MNADEQRYDSQNVLCRTCKFSFSHLQHTTHCAPTRWCYHLSESSLCFPFAIAAIRCVCNIELSWTPLQRQSTVSKKLKCIRCKIVRWHALEIKDYTKGYTESTPHKSTQCVRFCDLMRDHFSKYLLGLPLWYWGNHMIILVPMKQSWRVWMDDSYDLTQNYNIHKTKKDATTILWDILWAV